MNRRQLVVLLSCIFFSFYSAGAQVSNSIYSMFGVGRTVDYNFGINKSLGGTGIAFHTGRALNFANPATYLGILPNSMIIESGAYGIWSESASKKNSQATGNMNVSYFATGLYLADWWAFTFGIVPFSYINYEITSTDQIQGELTEFEKNFRGTGGFNRINVGNSFEIYKNLAIGLNASFIFGSINQTETALNTDSFAGYELTNQRRAHSFYLDYGIHYSIVRGEWLYSLGAIYGAAQKLNTTEALDFTYNNATIELDPDDLAAIRIPKKIGVGLALHKVRNFRLGLDYELNRWANLSFANPHLETKDSHRFAFGAELFPGQKLSEPWFRKIYYRLGVNYKNSYLEIDHIPIRSIGATVGLGVPISRISLINVAFELGKEGTQTKGLIEDRYWGFYLNFSLSELWAVKPRRR